MRRTLLAASSLVAIAAMGSTAFASSHREAPMITETPKLDATDFYMFRSYEPGRSGFVTLIANYLPLQDVYGGPNFFQLDPQAVYDINVDNAGTGTPSTTFRFRFTRTERKIALTIGGRSIPVPLVNVGPITASDNSAQNVLETFTVAKITYANGFPRLNAITNSSNNRTSFAKPMDNIGSKTFANYPGYAATFIYDVNIPDCGAGRLFVGQRKDPFVVNLAETFDLVNYANPVGEQFANSKRDDLADKNVTSLALEVPISCLVKGADPVIGGWTTSAKVVSGQSSLVQFSRLANPLVNELIIGLPNKDDFNKTVPSGDQRFGPYYRFPTAPALIEALFGTKAPTDLPRRDLPLVFLTGVPGLNAPANLVNQSEEMRLNTSILPAAYGAQNRLGVIAGDNAGYPNGRRLGDDIVDITLRVAMGRLYTLGLVGNPSQAPSGGLDFTDGAFTDSTHYDATFPYVRNPLNGSPQP